MGWFIFGVISTLAVGIFIWTVKRKGGHNESRIDDDIEREGILNKRIKRLQGELLVARSEISGSRSEISGLRERITQAEDRVKSTDSLIERIKKDNDLG